MRLYNATSCTPSGSQFRSKGSQTFAPLSFVPKPLRAIGRASLKPAKPVLPWHAKTVSRSSEPSKPINQTTSPSAPPTGTSDLVASESRILKETVDNNTVFCAVPTIQVLDSILREGSFVVSDPVNKSPPSETSSLTTLSLWDSETEADPFGLANQHPCDLGDFEHTSPKKSFVVKRSDAIERRGDKDVASMVDDRDDKPVVAPHSGTFTLSGFVPRNEVDGYASTRARLRKVPCKRNEDTPGTQRIFPTQESRRIPGGISELASVESSNQSSGPSFVTGRVFPHFDLPATVSSLDESNEQVSRRCKVKTNTDAIGMMTLNNSGSLGTTANQTEAHNDVYSKYFKMLKMGLPAGAVRHAMQRDGLDPAVLNLENMEQVPSQPTAKDHYRRFRLHWTTHADVRSNTVWAMVNRDAEISKMQIDENEFLSLFRADPNSVQNLAPSLKPCNHGAVKVIDPKRANNGGIILARVKLTYAQIADAVNGLDNDVMTPEQIKGILQFVPTKDERRALEEYLSEGLPADSLCECEKFMVAIMRIQHAERKLNAMLFVHNFESSLEELRQEARLVQEACEEIMASARLRKVLGIVLNLGNRVNTAGPSCREKAKAITMDSLLKLHQAKAFDKKTSFLDYLVMVIRRNNPGLLSFKEELLAIFKAERTNWQQLVAEPERLKKELEGVRNIALRLQCRPNANRTGGSQVSGSATMESFSLQEIEILEATPLGQFVLDACLRVASLANDVNQARGGFEKLLSYFGEQSSNLGSGQNGTIVPEDFFHSLCTFCRNFDCALDELNTRHVPAAPSKKQLSAPSGGIGIILDELKTESKLRWRRRSEMR